MQRFFIFCLFLHLFNHAHPSPQNSFTKSQAIAHTICMFFAINSSFLKKIQPLEDPNTTDAQKKIEANLDKLFSSPVSFLDYCPKHIIGKLFLEKFKIPQKQNLLTRVKNFLENKSFGEEVQEKIISLYIKYKFIFEKDFPTTVLLNNNIKKFFITISKDDILFDLFTNSPNLNFFGSYEYSITPPLPPQHEALKPYSHFLKKLLLVSSLSQALDSKNKNENEGLIRCAKEIFDLACIAKGIKPDIGRFLLQTLKILGAGTITAATLAFAIKRIRSLSRPTWNVLKNSFEYGTGGRGRTLYTLAYTLLKYGRN